MSLSLFIESLSKINGIVKNNSMTFKARQEEKNKKRHHRNRFYKKLTIEEDKLTDCKWEDIDPSNEVQMLGLAKWWWNSADNYKGWKEMLIEYNLNKDNERFKSVFYYQMVKAKQVPLKLSRLVFSKMFDVCFSRHIDFWIREIEKSERIIVNGGLNYFILKTLYDAVKSGKMVTKTWLYQNLDDDIDTFQSVFNGVITRLTNKEYIEPYHSCGILHYKICSKMDYDYIGDYFYEMTLDDLMEKLTTQRS